MPSLREDAQAIAESVDARYFTGRPPTLLSQPVILKLLAALEAGNYRKIACSVAGLSPNAFYDALKVDPTFRDAVEKAEAIAESALVQATTKAGQLPQFWAANMTLLERKHPDRWGRRQDDSSTPKVVVQIGISASDVKVLVQAPQPQLEPVDTFAQLPSLSPGSHET